jgi:beta-glucosidase
VIFGIDAVHGHNNIVGATLYPHNIGLGAANDVELTRRIGAATAEEVAATGIDWTFAPTLAVPGDRRWGRTYEGYSEDPAIVRRLGRAAVLGLQGEPGAGPLIQAGNVAATAKHFIGDGGTVEGEDEGDNIASEEELVATHLPGYLGAFDAHVLTVMASFSSWHGTKMHANRSLLTGILKDRMGFDGFVIGDWNGHSQVPGCTRDHCPEALVAGVDMLMAPLGWRALFTNTLADVRSGALPEARLDDAVRRILRVKVRLGLFEPERPFEARLDRIGGPQHRALAREAVARSLVLLKNDGVLPIRAGARVLVTGPFADDVGLQSGGWTISWQGTHNTKADFPNAQSVLAGLKEALAAGGGAVIADTADVAVARPDVAIVVYGESPYAEMFGDLKLSFYEARGPLSRLKELRRRGIPVVSVFLSGRPLWVNPELNASNAFVAAWWPGTEAGGIADVLVGDAKGRPRRDFTGRLPYRWPLTVSDAPYFSAVRDESLPVGFGLTYAAPAPVVSYDERLGR